MFGSRYDDMCTKLGVVRIYKKKLTSKEAKIEAKYRTRELMLYSSLSITIATVLLMLTRIFDLHIIKFTKCFLPELFE